MDLDALDSQAVKVGEIRLKAGSTKTHRAHTIGLEVSPALRALLASMKLAAGCDAVYVFGAHKPYTVDMLGAARTRLKEVYGAPEFTWQLLRSTCATYLTNAPGIYASATVFRSARQLGHSVAIAERSYLAVLRGIPKGAATLEDAMQIPSSLRKSVLRIAASTGDARLRAVC